MIITMISWIFHAMAVKFKSRRRVDKSNVTLVKFKIRNQRHGISGDTQGTVLLLSCDVM